ncbi:MAG: hypothetical protein JWQ43_2779 [Glaciihabitans sp.]|nr:hypothetical protein [Glaciihabitans sp.]
MERPVWCGPCHRPRCAVGQRTLPTAPNRTGAESSDKSSYPLREPCLHCHGHTRQCQFPMTRVVHQLRRRPPLCRGIRLHCKQRRPDSASHVGTEWAGSCRFTVDRSYGAPAGTRTLTECILSALPLPIGLPGPTARLVALTGNEQSFLLCVVMLALTVPAGRPREGPPGR